nr:MAG TPA: hypothetical protein [Caudoviricetes sp.]
MHVCVFMDLWNISLYFCRRKQYIAASCDYLRIP